MKITSKNKQNSYYADKFRANFRKLLEKPDDYINDMRSDRKHNYALMEPCQMEYYDEYLNEMKKQRHDLHQMEIINLINQDDVDDIVEKQDLHRVKRIFRNN